MSEINEHYQSLDEITAIVNSFETCEIAPAQFSHGLHIAVATWYLTQSSYEEAEKQMRDGLHRFLAHYNLNGYNETITLFWMKAVQNFLLQSREKDSIVATLNEAVEHFSDSKLIFQFYSREHLMSDEAKKSWVEPDLLPLEFNS